MRYSQSNELGSRPWYEQFWPWFLIAIPLFAVITGVLTVVIATVTSDGLVVDDYYKRGLSINRVLARDHKAAELGVKAMVRFDYASGKVHIQLQARDSQTLENTLHLQMWHPVHANKDIEIILQHEGGGGYYGTLAPLPTGYWHLLIEPETKQWRLTGRAKVPTQRTVQLDATST
jgi:hypothetical protein